VSRISRIPIRLRVTLVFTSVMAIVLAGVGLFLHLRLGIELDTTIEQSLENRSNVVDVYARYLRE
jgi:hypothetical protein